MRESIGRENDNLDDYLGQAKTNSGWLAGGPTICIFAFSINIRNQVNYGWRCCSWTSSVDQSLESKMGRHEISFIVWT
jgi:hypothetical protein